MKFSASSGNRMQNTSLRLTRREGGYSMSELVIVISIMGVLAGITVVSMSQYLSGGKNALALARQEMLNQGVYRFAQQNYQLVFSQISDSSGDELAVLRTLQYRDPNIYRAKVGSPYVDPRYNPITSSDSTQYRLQWMGKMFGLLMPGDSGSGLLMNFDGTDFTTAFVFPPDFQMAGN